MLMHDICRVTSFDNPLITSYEKFKFNSTNIKILKITSREKFYFGHQSQKLTKIHTL